MAGISMGGLAMRMVVAGATIAMLGLQWLWWGPPRAAEAQARAGEWQHDVGASADMGPTGDIAADQSGLFVINFADIGPVGGSYQHSLDHYTPGGALTRRWTGDVTPKENGYDANPRVAAYGGTGYSAISEVIDNNNPTSVIRQHPANGSPGWAQVHPRPDEMVADATGLYLHAVRNEGGVFRGIIRKLDPVTGAEIWTRSADYPLASGGLYPGRRGIAIGDGSLYVIGSRTGEGRVYVRRYDLTDGAETWPTPIDLGPFWHGNSIGATNGGLYVGTTYYPDSSGNRGARVSRYDLTPSPIWTKEIAIDGESAASFAGIAADASTFSLLFETPPPNGGGGAIVSTIRTYDSTGTEIGDREFPLTPSPSGAYRSVVNYTARDGGTYVLGGYDPSGQGDSRVAIARLLPRINLKGKVTWSDAYPDKVGQGVQGATVKVGDQTFTTDAQGEYEVGSDLVGQDATVMMPIFDHSGAQAMVDERGALLLGKAAAAGSNISLTINEQIKLTLDPATGKLKTTATFGKNVQFKGFGQTLNLTNLKLTDQGVQTVRGTAQLAFKYDANSPPISLNVTLNYVKASNELTISGAPGSQFQWGGQTATLSKFDLRSSPTVNTVTVEGTIALKLSGVPIDATLKGVGTAQGVVLTAVGTAVVQGITLTFDPITVENGQFRVKGRVKLPNQPVELAFDTTTGFGAPRLILPLPQFTWDGQTLPLRLELLGNAMILAGEGNVQIGGQAVTLKVDTQFNALSLQSTTVRVQAIIPLPEGGEATAKLEYNPTQPQNSAVTGTMKVFLALCPGQKTDFNVDVRASAASIRLGFRTQIPVDCDGNGTSTLVDVNGDFDGQLAQLQVSWPVTVGNSNGRVSATVTGDGTFFQLMFNVELKFGPGGPGSSSGQANARPNGATAPRPNTGAAAASNVRLLLTDGVGRRTGFDPATGQIVSEIPGGQWTGLVDGMDTFTMPGRVGGYAVTLFSQTQQQVTLAMTVNGQTTTFTAAVGPSAPTTLAAEAVPQGSGVAVQIGPLAVGCAPRPPVRIVPAPGAPGALQATFTAAPGSNAATNAIREIRIGQAANGVVDADGRTNLGAGSVITFPSPVTSATLTVRRVTSGQATTVPLTIVDGCGEWQTFVGGGAGAF